MVGMAKEISAPVLAAPTFSGMRATVHELPEQAVQRAGDPIEVAYATVDSPVGRLLLAATPKGLARVAFAVEDHDRVLEELAVELSPRILYSPEQLGDAAHELDEYFARKRKVFDLDLDLSLSHGFGRLVQSHLPKIGYGKTRSYQEVAELVGNPKAVRAVGAACASNPLPIVLPCHRVVRSDGSLGGYLGGLDVKTALLELEATA